MVGILLGQIAARASYADLLAAAAQVPMLGHRRDDHDHVPKSLLVVPAVGCNHPGAYLPG
ncbi:MAG: hypothetical protein ACRDRK_01370 [Pseudonocardia sp.]